MAQLAKLPQAERIRDKGYEILYLTDEPDQFVVNALGEVDGKAFKSVDDDDALPETDEEKAAPEQKAEESKPVLDFVKETLGDQIKEARVSKILKTGAVCLTADGPITLEMEKYFQKVDPENAGNMKAQRVLELNPDSPAFAALKRAVEERQGAGRQVRPAPLRPGPADRRPAPGRPGGVHRAGVFPDEVSIKMPLALPPGAFFTLFSQTPPGGRTGPPLQPGTARGETVRFR